MGKREFLNSKIMHLYEQRKAEEAKQRPSFQIKNQNYNEFELAKVFDVSEPYNFVQFLTTNFSDEEI